MKILSVMSREIIGCCFVEFCQEQKSEYPIKMFEEKLLTKVPDSKVSRLYRKDFDVITDLLEGNGAQQSYWLVNVKSEFYLLPRPAKPELFNGLDGFSLLNGADVNPANVAYCLPAIIVKSENNQIQEKRWVISGDDDKGKVSDEASDEDEETSSRDLDASIVNNDEKRREIDTIPVRKPVNKMPISNPVTEECDNKLKVQIENAYVQYCTTLAAEFYNVNCDFRTEFNDFLKSVIGLENLSVISVRHDGCLNPEFYIEEMSEEPDQNWRISWLVFSPGKAPNFGYLVPAIIVQQAPSGNPIWGELDPAISIEGEKDSRFTARDSRKIVAALLIRDLDDEKKRRWELSKQGEIDPFLDSDEIKELLQQEYVRLHTRVRSGNMKPEKMDEEINRILSRPNICGRFTIVFRAIHNGKPIFVTALSLNNAPRDYSYWLAYPEHHERWAFLFPRLVSGVVGYRRKLLFSDLNENAFEIDGIPDTDPTLLKNIIPCEAELLSDNSTGYKLDLGYKVKVKGLINY